MSTKICGIYKITSPTGKIYIGQSIDIKRRWRYHRHLSDSYHINILYRSFIKHGVDNHKFEILEECDRKLLNERERFYIEKYDTFQTLNGMNLTKGGDSKVEFSESTIQKISLAKKGKRPVHLIGYTHSDETKELLKQKSIGNKNWLGKHHSEETKEKLRIISTGRTCFEETRRKIGLKNKGNKSRLGFTYTEDEKKEIAIRNTGKKNNVPRTSIYYGVSFSKPKNRWRSVIKIDKKQKHIGTFKTEVEAAKAYDEFVIKNIPYEIPLNF